MGSIKENKKFKRSVEQNHPTNPKIRKNDTTDFDLDTNTIKEKKKKQ